MKKKNILLGALALILVAAVSVGGTLAYLTASASVVNTFTVGDVEITLTEPAYTGNNQKLIPGTTIAKDPTVTVKANSEDCYVRVKVTVPEKLQGIVELNIDTANWQREGTTDVYRYIGGTNGIVKNSNADTALPKVFTTVTIPGTVTGEQLEKLTEADLKITVDAYAIQAEGFANADAAWTNFPIA